MALSRHHVLPCHRPQRCLSCGDLSPSQPLTLDQPDRLTDNQKHISYCISDGTNTNMVGWQLAQSSKDRTSVSNSAGLMTLFSQQFKTLQRS